MALTYHDNQNLDWGEGGKKILTHMTKFVPWRWPFWALGIDEKGPCIKGRQQDESRVMKQVERAFTNSRSGQTNRTSSSRDVDMKVIMPFERATNYLRQHALLEKNR